MDDVRQITGRARTGIRVHWITSVSDDAFNLWPMPDVTKPPLHALPHAELMAKLDVGSFPGWKDVPTW